MFGSEALEVAIGLSLLFLFVSLICTAAREALEAKLKTRAMDMERGLREMLDDPDGSTYAKALFDHPMIYALFGGHYDPSGLRKVRSLTGATETLIMSYAKRKNLPSYIPAGHFAAALIDLVARGNATPPAYAQPGAPQGLPLTEPLTVASLREAAANFPNEKIKRALISAIDNAEGDLAAVKTNLETWFNGTMDRVSGWYKRRTQFILFVIGMFAAIALNIDAITVAQRLGSDETLRKAVVSQAERITTTSTSTAKQNVDANAQGGTTAAAIPAALAQKDVRGLRKDLQDIGFPIGWDKWMPVPQQLNCTGRNLCFSGIYFLAVLKMILGWLITALAVMLGAPFWFDVLSKFMAIRSSVKPRVKSEKEGSAEQPPPESPLLGLTALKGPAGKAPARKPPAAPPPPAIAFTPHEWSSGPKDKGVL